MSWIPLHWAENIKDPKFPSKIEAIHLGSQWWCKFKALIRKISPWLTSRTGHFDGLSVTAGTFSIQSRLNIYKEKRKKIRQSTINSLHLPQNMITLNTAAKNFIDNRMPQVYKVDTLKMSFLPQLFMLYTLKLKNPRPAYTVFRFISCWWRNSQLKAWTLSPLVNCFMRRQVVLGTRFFLF